MHANRIMPPCGILNNIYIYNALRKRQVAITYTLLHVRESRHAYFCTATQTILKFFLRPRTSQNIKGTVAEKVRTYENSRINTISHIAVLCDLLTRTNRITEAFENEPREF